MARLFLTAQWRNLAVLNFPIEANLLAPYVPQGTELDLFQGQAYVSIVGFSFLHAKVFGLPLPGHSNFPEVNLRFYVRRFAGSELRRGVTFIQEIAPRRLVTLVARRLYNENYVTRPMRCSPGARADSPQDAVEYAWQDHGRWNRVSLMPSGEPRRPARHSFEEYIIENYWGYASQPHGASLEYRVEHPAWRIVPARDVIWDCDAAGTYGAPLARYLETPASAFLVDGSAVRMFCGEPVPQAAPGVSQSAVHSSGR